MIIAYPLRLYVGVTCSNTGHRIDFLGLGFFVIFLRVARKFPTYWTVENCQDLLLADHCLSTIRDNFHITSSHYKPRSRKGLVKLYTKQWKLQRKIREFKNIKMRKSSNYRIIGFFKLRKNSVRYRISFLL